MRDSTCHHTSSSNVNLIGTLLVAFLMTLGTYTIGLAQSTATPAGSPPLMSSKLTKQIGVFMIMKARPTLRDELISKLRAFSEGVEKTRVGPSVFIVHTFSSEPELVYIYLLVDKSQSGRLDPLVSRLKQEGEAYIAFTTVYPLNPLFGTFHN